MSTPGTFQIIANDGKQDRLLMATALLNKRLGLIESSRTSNPLIKDPTPTLLDIEKTHILFMNAHFKPFAAIGFEYNKVSVAASGFDTTITFQIPQFGDFFSDMCVRFKINAPTVSYTTNFAPTDASTSVQGAQHSPAFRWCHYPGERLMQKVAFTVNNNPLDEYTPNAVNMHREYMVQPNKMPGWNRCVGQETAMQGYYRQPGVDLTGAASGSTGLVGSGIAPVSHRVSSAVSIGPQTPKLTPDSLDMFIPLLFWFNKDPRLAIPGVSLPNGMRNITITLAKRVDMYGLVPRGVGTWADPKGTLVPPATDFDKAELYINNIFVNSEIHDIFIKRVGFVLVRIHREQIITVNQDTSSQLLSNLKWPIEVMFVGMRMESYTENAWNLDKWHTFSSVTNTEYAVNQALSAASSTTLTGTVFSISSAGVVTATGINTAQVAVGDAVLVCGHLGTVVSISAGTSFTVTPAPGGTTTDTTDRTTAIKFTAPKVEVPVQADTIDTLSITVQGVPFYNGWSTAFYESYLPSAYGGQTLKTPNKGLLMVNFCLYPGLYQPNGHINVSRSREFYIGYTSSIINTNTKGRLIVVAQCINFLLISDGSAVLRYST